MTREEKALLFTGSNLDAQQSATQKLMEATVYLRRAGDSLMAVQAMLETSDDKDRIKYFRILIDKESIWLDQLFQTAAPRYFG